MYRSIPEDRDLHNTQTQQDDQADLDAQLQIEVPKDERGEDSQEQIRRRVECVGEVGKLDDRGRVTAACLHSDIPEDVHVATNAKWKHGRNNISCELNGKHRPQRDLISFVGAEDGQ